MEPESGSAPVKRGLTLLGALAAVGLLSACGSGSDGNTKASSSAGLGAPPPSRYSGFETRYPAAYPKPARKAGFHFTLGFLNPVGANESQHAIQLGMQRQTEALGGTFLAKDDQLKVDKQVSDFDQLLAQRVDAIVVYPLDAKALGPELDKAKRAGVPVIGMDVAHGEGQGLSPGYATEVRQARDREAFNMTRTMAQRLGRVKVGLMGFGQPVPSIEFLLARLRYWAARNGLTVVGRQDNPTDDAAGGQTAANGLLGQHPDLGGIIAYNDPTALGAVAAAAGSGRRILAVGDNGGSDGLTGVESGRLLATMQNDSVGMGAQSAVAAYDLLTKQHLPLAPIVMRQARLVTKDTLGQIKTWPEQEAAIGGVG
jgi:ribose transport system substrate-binding protein